MPASGAARSQPTSLRDSLSLCTFRDCLKVGPDPLTLDSTRLAQQGLDVQIVDQVCRAPGPHQDLSSC
jgi:hypothetical protein